MATSGLRAVVAAGALLLAIGEGAEAEEKVSKVNAGISVMLLGTIGFMMGLFELTHCYRPAMAKYTWKAISATISIFSAVLIFQGVNGLVEAYILEGVSEKTELMIDVAHFFIWFILLQAVLAYMSGAVSSVPTDPAPELLDFWETRLKCFAVLIGHITGFAAINAFATLQQQVPRTVLTTAIVPLLAWVIVFLMGRVSDHARDLVALSDDGMRDAFEEKWDEQTEETEDDVIGLAVSFCLVQSLRFAIGGYLPNSEGEEPEAVMLTHTNIQCIALFCVGYALVAAEVLRILYTKFAIPRITAQFSNIAGMTFSWCIFFGMDWGMVANFFHNNGGMIKVVSIAIVVTMVAMAMIFVLERVAGMSSSMQSVVRALVNSIGILIGFAWEKAFDVAVAEVAETANFLSFISPPWIKMLLAIGLAGMVVPAWKRHILPTILQIEKEEEDEAGEREKTGLEERLLNLECMGADELRAALADLQRKAADLERRSQQCQGLEEQNTVLERSMDSIRKELSSLEALAGILAK